MKKIVFVVFLALMLGCTSEKQSKAKAVQQTDSVIGIKKIPKKEVREKLFPELVKVHFYDTQKDSIVPYASLNDLLDIKFNYIQLERILDSNVVYFSGDSIEITIEKKNFHKEEYEMGFKSHLGTTINGQRFEGVDVDVPAKEIVSGVKVVFNNTQSVVLNPKDYENLAQPRFDMMSAYKIDERTVLIQMNNSDGAYGYAVYLFVSATGKTKRMIVYT
jgi:hypothetical protein